MFMISRILLLFNLLSVTILLDSCNFRKDQSDNAVQDEEKLGFWSSLIQKDSLLWEKEDILDQEMVNYIYSLNNLDSSQIVNSIQDAIQCLNDSANLYKFWDKVNHYSYHPNSPVRNDEISLVLFQELVKISTVKEPYKVRYNHIINLLKKNRPGYLANDFEIIDKSGNIKSLYSIKSPLLLVMFYDPNCHTCHDIIKSLEASKILSNLINQEKVNVLTVNVLLQEKKQSLIHDMPHSWISASDPDQSILNEELYNILAYPTIYLLDQDKKVILKDVDLKQTLQYLNSIS